MKAPFLIGRLLFGDRKPPTKLQSQAEEGNPPSAETEPEAPEKHGQIGDIMGTVAPLHKSLRHQSHIRIRAFQLQPGVMVA